MAADLYSVDGKKVKTVELPEQFSEAYDLDLIQRAYRANRLHQFQSSGAYINAGQGVSAKLSRRRRDYKGSYGLGISRTPRKVLWRRGTQFGWVGALAPGTVGGRRSHPPKSEATYLIKINKKENQKAIRSTLAGLAQANHVLLAENGIESLQKAKDVLKFLSAVSLSAAETRRSKTGKAKLRGRKHSTALGPVFIVSKDCALRTAARNLPGTEVHVVNHLNVGVFMKHPDGHFRQTVWSQEALQLLQNKRLYFPSGAGKQ
ncbi:50S ribosomal protein L4 [Candidatus Woesearchaeota archaeon]|nr:50S ribosomal protein L4 [Candidatus Woesearchaeota archaeon]